MENSKIDLMIDIETMSSEPTAAVVQIGVAAIDWNDCAVWPFFESRVDPDDASMYGTVSEATMDWWKTQPDSTREFVFGGKLKLAEVLGFLSRVVERNHIGAVWAHPPQFDLVILRHAFFGIGRTCPWHYRQERCYRTMWNMFPECKPREREGEHHNAMDDAIYQAKCLTDIVRGVRWSRQGL